ncbi:MAG TPA: hypothetical protein VG276_28475 [Actinomycetes bacterium]|nr:hypothetical protein [Actinomycetes bacterium]
MKGKSAIALGLTIGYVLGTKAGRERYEQLSESAKRLAENPSMQRLQEEVSSLFSASKSRASTTIEGKVTQVADKAADSVGAARERATGTGTTGTTSSGSGTTSSGSGTTGSGSGTTGSGSGTTDSGSGTTDSGTGTTRKSRSSSSSSTAPTSSGTGGTDL